MGITEHKTQSVRHKDGYAVQQQITIDNSILPPAEEIIKLHGIDSGIMDWLKAHTEKEQETRINANSAGLEIVKEEMKTARIALFITSAVMFTAMALTGLFLFIGQELGSGAKKTI